MCLPAVRGGLCALPEIRVLQFLEPWDDPRNDLAGTSRAQRVTGLRIAGMSRRRPRSARTQRRADERREAALFRRLHARARELTYQPASLDEALRQEPRLLDAALPGRYAARQALFRGRPELLPPEGRLVLSLIPVADAVLVKAGAGWSPASDWWGRATWPDMLRWGLDKEADTCRLLRAGQTYGAVVVARAQLERWTMNVAAHHKVAAMTGDESAASYIRRVWSVYPDIAGTIDMGLAWTDLSEWLHGRGLITAALRESAAAASTKGPAGPGGATTASGVMNDLLRVHQRVSTVAEIVLRQVRGGVTLLAIEHYGHKFTPALQTVLLPEEDGGTELPDLPALIGALDYHAVSGETGKRALLRADTYRMFVSYSGAEGLMSTGTSPALGEGALLERRGRAVARALEAYRAEQQQFGDDFDPGTLDARLFRYIAISEAAFVTADWASGPEADALRTAAAALQSAWWLWLEDTDDAMACVRGVLEQACRTRAHRVKPSRAARVEGMGAGASPVRWLEAAGWKRLAVLGLALGEFAHISFRMRWNGARDALAALQADGTPRPDSTARGHALDASAYLLAHEVAARLDQACPAVAAAFRARVTLLDADKHERYVEELLQRSLDLRGTDFGPPEVRPLPTSA